MKDSIQTSRSGECPLHDHALTEPSLFRPEDLVRAVREQRGAGARSIPPLGVLEFDGDLTDKLIARNEVVRCPDWPCFHTETHVTNAADHDGEPFHKGPEDADLLILTAISSLATCRSNGMPILKGSEY